MNKIILMGRLTKDPETRQAGETTLTRFTLAVDRRYKQDGGANADFPNCIAFGKTAEFIQKYLHKGMKICLDGRLQTGSYKKQDGNTVYTTEVIAENVEFAESKKTDAGTDAGNTSEWVEVTDDDGLPF